MQDQLLARGLGSEFDMPSVYITGPEGIAATSTARIIQPGDVMMIDWGVQLMNFGTDVKRVAYVLKPGETAPPKSIQNAFDRALAVRDVLKRAIRTLWITLDELDGHKKGMSEVSRNVRQVSRELDGLAAEDLADVKEGIALAKTGHR